MSLLLLCSQNGLNALDFTLDHNFKLWYIFTAIFSLYLYQVKS